MGIKRGVSSYSYQNLIFDHKMNWKQFIRQVHELGTDGIEMIDETYIRDYPFISDEFVFGWNNELARYNMKAITMDVYLDVLQFRDHVMTHAEAAERLKRDLVIASKLGFENIRCLVTMPIDAIESCLELAEKLNIRIGLEIHAPIQLVYNPKTAKKLHFSAPLNVVDEVIDMIQRTKTKHAGLVPDMGLFQHDVTPAMVDNAKRSCGNPDAVDFVMESKKSMSADEITSKLETTYPNLNIASLGHFFLQTQGSAKQEELLKVIPYTLSIHGKFYEMIEDPANPGHYFDPSIDYAKVFKYLKQGGFDGYINSEFEGQRSKNDLPDEQMFDEIEQVRRHHAMMVDLGAQ